MDFYSNFLQSDVGYKERSQESSTRRNILSAELNRHKFIKDEEICVYLAGSLARNEYGKKSDADFFIISQEKPTKIKQYRIYSALIEINEKLNYPEFSNSAKYLRVYSIKDLISATGSPRDDNENLFTARQLLLLESKPVYNEDFFERFLKDVLGYYFTDDDGSGEFKPIFLLNDILRYWRTLCLNYEQIRQDKTRLWRKKNINLKFSRKLTIFSTVIPMIIEKKVSINFMKDLCSMTPLERFALGLDKLEGMQYAEDFKYFLEKYEFFISAKEMSQEDVNKETKIQLDEDANWIKFFIERILTDISKNNDLAIYLRQ